MRQPAARDEAPWAGARAATRVSPYEGQKRLLSEHPPCCVSFRGSARNLRFHTAPTPLVPQACALANRKIPRGTRNDREGRPPPIFHSATQLSFRGSARNLRPHIGPTPLYSKPAPRHTLHPHPNPLPSRERGLVTPPPSLSPREVLEGGEAAKQPRPLLKTKTGRAGGHRLIPRRGQGEDPFPRDTQRSLDRGRGAGIYSPLHLRQAGTAGSAGQTAN